MKKVLILIFLITFSCSKKENHITVAKDFSVNILSGQIDQAKNYATESTAKQIEMAIGFFGQQKVDPNFKFEFIKDSVSKNEAWVKFKNLNDNKEDKLYLIKIDDKWRVHFDKKKQELFK